MKLKNSLKGSIIIMVSIAAVILATYSSFNKEIIINIDGQTTKIDTISKTVEDVLNSKNINLKDGSRLEPSLGTKIKNNMEIKIVNQFKINIEDGGTQTEYITNLESVGEVLESFNIELNDNDIINKGLEEKIEKDEVIKITRVTEEIVTERQSIPFETEIVKEKKLLKGEKEIYTKGKNGTREISYKITYNDGKVVSKEKVSDKITKKPVKEVIKEGALESHSI